MIGYEEVLITLNNMIYVYPLHNTVSFTVISRKHVEYIRKIGLDNVYYIDELDFSSFYPLIRYDTVLNTHIYIWNRVIQIFYRSVNENLKHKITKLIEDFNNKFNNCKITRGCNRLGVY